MNVFKYLSPEETAPDTEAAVDVVEVDTLTDVEHEDTVDDIEEMHASINDVASLEHHVTSMINVSDVIENFSKEGITVVAADSINAHIDGVQSFVTMKGGPALNLRTFTPEDFSDEATPESRAVIAAASAEDFKEKALVGVKKAIEFFLNLLKRIQETIARLFSNTEKLKARAEAILAKSKTPYSSPEGEKSAPTGLQVNGHYNAVLAVKSFRANFNAVMHHADIKSVVGQEDFKAVVKYALSPAKDADFSEIMFPHYGAKAKDAKTIASFGGNVDVGVGNGALYSVNVKSEAKKIKALTKSEIAEIATKVIEEYEFIKKIKTDIDTIKGNYEDLVNKSDALLKKYDPSAHPKLVSYISKVMSKAFTKSGIAVISRIGTLSYMTCADAIRLCEWSMSGKATGKAKESAAIK